MNIIDITMDLSDPRGVFPGDPITVVTYDKRISSGDAFNTSLISCGSHSGTHLDVPLHFIEDGASLETVDLDALCGWVYVTQVFDQGPITAEILDTANIDKSATRLLVKTSKHLPNHSLMADAAPQGLSKSGAKWLLENGFTLIGIESKNIESSGNTDFEVHKLLLKQNILILEGLEMTGVRAGWYTLFCLPLKVGMADGAPVRAILVTD